MTTRIAACRHLDRLYIILNAFSNLVNEGASQCIPEWKCAALEFMECVCDYINTYNAGQLGTYPALAVYLATEWCAYGYVDNDTFRPLIDFCVSAVNYDHFGRDCRVTLILALSRMKADAMNGIVRSTQSHLDARLCDLLDNTYEHYQSYQNVLYDIVRQTPAPAPPAPEPPAPAPPVPAPPAPVPPAVPAASPEVISETKIIKDMIDTVDSMEPFSNARNYSSCELFAYVVRKLPIYLCDERFHNWPGAVVTKIVECWSQRDKLKGTGGTPLGESLTVALSHIAPGDHRGLSTWTVSATTCLLPAIITRESRIALINTIRDAAAHMDSMASTLKVIQEAGVLRGYVLRSGYKVSRRQETGSMLFELKPTGCLTKETNEIVVLDDSSWVYDNECLCDDCYDYCCDGPYTDSEGDDCDSEGAWFRRDDMVNIG
jgi:hypothetical protein